MQHPHNRQHQQRGHYEPRGAQERGLFVVADDEEGEEEEGEGEEGEGKEGGVGGRPQQQHQQHHQRAQDRGPMTRDQVSQKRAEVAERNRQRWMREMGAAGLG
jgi:hypothetical protein